MKIKKEVSLDVNEKRKSFPIKGVLSILVTIFSFSFLYLLMFFSIPESNKDIVNISIGMLIGAGFSSVFTYYFGSSEGMKTKKYLFTNNDDDDDDDDNDVVDVVDVVEDKHKT